MDDLSIEEAQSLPLKYPEGAWIARCGMVFPSKIQWLYKSFTKQSITQDTSIPDISNSSIIYGDDIVTFGSGRVASKLCTIDEQISLDWLAQAIRQKLWKQFYNTDRVTADHVGENKLTASLISVLNNSKDLEILSDWDNLQVSLNRKNNSIAWTFDMQTTQSITLVQVKGQVYY